MKLNINSVSARLYRWFYSTHKMPENLCPYFWKLVLMWVFILPYSLLSLPTIIMDWKESDIKTTGERMGTGVVAWLILFILICMLSVFGVFFMKFPNEKSPWWTMLTIGLICWGATIVIASLELIKFSIKKWKNRHIKYDKDGYRIWEPVKEKQDSIIIEFVKAKSNKYCPRIDWK
jgi:hypothetical protein